MSVEITFRTLKGASFKLIAPPAETVLELKKKVGEQQKVENYAGFRLIYKGKILADDATVESAAITSAGFVVVMPPKKTPVKPSAEAPKPEPAKKQPAEDKGAPSAQPAAASEPQSSTAAAPAAPAAAPTTAPAAAPTAVPAAAPAAAPAASSGEQSADGANSLVTGDEYIASVRQICEMGFPEAKVKKALRAAFNNPQRAVDYLFSGIPETVVPPASATAPRVPPRAGDPAATAPPTGNADRAPPSATPFNMFEAPPAGGGGGQGAPGNLDFLRGHPQFNMMRRLIQANPSVLPQLLQQLEVQNPSLLAMIDANQIEFTRLINEPLREGELGGDEALEQAAQAMAGAAGLAGQPGTDQVMVSEEEHQQIVRLSELGASIGLEESDVVETWLACNRDEDLAANYLVDHAEELRADSQRNAQNSSNPSNGPGAGDGGPPS